MGTRIRFFRLDKKIVNFDKGVDDDFRGLPLNYSKRISVKGGKIDSLKRLLNLTFCL